MADESISAVLGVVEEAKRNWGGEGDFGEFVMKEFLPSITEQQSQQDPEKQGAIQRYKTYFGDMTDV